MKRSLRTFGHGVPLGLTIEGANRHDMKLVRPTIESIIVDRPEPSEEHPQGMCLDKGYDYEGVRAILSEFGFTATFVHAGKRLRRSRGKLVLRHGGGWWNERIPG